ncbi:MAG: N-acetylmuramoyl-L-alanine amidase [Actinobacteria bacterium]|nr:N-acetylmuramoyl-L-alanine amidase [Actinomycetota bacterium]
MVIRPGARGRAVRDIQLRLLALGYDIDDAERATEYGPTTTSAVRAFQQQRGLLVDGVVGPESWRELVEASWRLGDRVMYLRSPQIRGDDVRDLQERLSALGFDTGRIDGIFGPRTAAAVREFQTNYGIPPDGIVAKSTVRALAGLPHLGHASVPPAARVREREALRRIGGMAGLRVVLDPGHGGDDEGSTGPTGVTEAGCVYALARELEAALATSGAAVYLTRDLSSAPTDGERAALANSLHADLFISLHVAAHDDTAANGAATFYYGHERFESEAGARLAELAQESVCELGLVDGRTHAKTFPILRETRMPAIQIEPCYVSNPREELLLDDPAFRRRLATAIAGAVREFVSSAVPA